MRAYFCFLNWTIQNRLPKYVMALSINKEVLEEF